VTRICLGVHRKLEKSGALNVTERLQIANNLLFILFTMKLCQQIYINPGIDFFLFVSSVLKDEDLERGNKS
jgi:hypothetical protein